MAHNDFFIPGPHAEARDLVERTVAGMGYTIADLPNGARKFERGSKAKTVWLGVWAGKDFWFWCTGEYFTGPNGEFIARISSNTGHGLLGGVYGVAKAATMYDALIAQVYQELSASGRLSNVITG